METMRIGVHIADFTWPNGPSALATELAGVARTAEDAGLDLISVMDHLFQIRGIGPPEHEMLEAYTTLGYLAASTSRVRLLTVATCAVYREPGVLIKQTTTLDVLSQGRAMLGIGAGWFDGEARGLGVPFPPLAERFERLEETLQIAQRMWSDSDEPFDGPFHHLERPLNSPQSISRPHPPILVAGSGERKTLRLVAKYGQACNLFAGADVPHKLDVLREHCANEGTDYDAIEKTAMYTFDLGRNGENAGKIVDDLGALAEQGIQTVTGRVLDVWERTPLEILGRDVIPAVSGL